MGLFKLFEEEKRFRVRNHFEDFHLIYCRTWVWKLVDELLDHEKDHEIEKENLKKAWIEVTQKQFRQESNFLLIIGTIYDFGL